LTPYTIDSAVQYCREGGEMTSLRNKFALLALVTAVAAAGASSALADDGIVSETSSTSQGAVVYNHSNNPGTTCTITAFGGVYAGFLSLVFTPSGNVMQQCTTKLVWGAPVCKTEVLKIGDLILVVTPGGLANMSIHVRV
jgi:hypothetical protein